MTVTIASDVFGAIHAEAAHSPDREICGLLFGEDDRIEGYRRCTNVSPTPVDSFELDPRALIDAYRSAREGGPRIAGWYHSHPAGTTRPSVRDAASAAPDGSLWLIVARGRTGLFRATVGGRWHDRFEPVAYAVVPCACADS